MFLVEDKPCGNLVFTWEDPRKAGYTGQVVEGVDLDYRMEVVHDRPEDIPALNPALAAIRKIPNSSKCSSTTASESRRAINRSTERRLYSAPGPTISGHATPTCLRTNNGIGTWTSWTKLPVADAIARSRRTPRRTVVETKLRRGLRVAPWSIAVFAKCGICRRQRRLTKFVC